jgi:phenylalanyl-tRNA synthetase beta chain
MRFTLSWLKDFLITDASLDIIAKKLVDIGIEVESIDDRSILKPFIIAEILEAEKHPEADKLQICKVNNGKEILQIVCGAPNARAGIKVVLGMTGTLIPVGGFKLKPTVIRGIESQGMMCSARELGIGSDHDGIIELPNNVEVGNNFAQVMGYDDPIIEVAITPNRGDCFGVYGIARDLAATGIGTLKELVIKNVKSEIDSNTKIKIADKDGCSHFIGRNFTNVKNCTSPDWLKARLIAAGQEPISALVDITNYISLAFARPLHIYDAKKIGNLIVRNSIAGEKFTALNNKNYELLPDLTVIADDKEIHAIAGVIGGLNSGCSLDTSEIFLESAYFDPIKVRNAGSKLFIDTDSRQRFERGVDPEFTMIGAEIASQMIIEICGGKASDWVIAGDVIDNHKHIDFDINNIKKITGYECKKDKVIAILQNLGFKVEDNGLLKVISPSWRHDISIKQDLVEEVIRICGYDQVPEIAMQNNIEVGKQILFGVNKLKFSLLRVVAAQGFVEQVTWSFMDDARAAIFSDIDESLKLVNPISSELNYMRPTMIANLLDITLSNFNHGHKSLSIFEIGSIFANQYENKQTQILTMLRSNMFSDRNIYNNSRQVDFYDIKSDVWEVLNNAGFAPDKMSLNRDVPHYFHPGKSACLAMGKNVAAYFGEIHPEILKKWDITVPVIIAEIFLDNLPQTKTKKTNRGKFIVSNYQNVERDFAFIINREIMVGEIMKTISNLDKNLIKSCKIFDIYQGKNIDNDKKSIAFNVIMQANDHTLSEDEINNISNKIIDTMNQKYQAQLRS